jgi:serine protease Do
MKGKLMLRKSTLFILIFLSVPTTTFLAEARDAKRDLDPGIELVEMFQKTFIHLAERAKPMVVNISPLIVTASLLGHNEELLESPEEQTPEAPRGFGSGVIIDRKGFIVTNHHVVGDAKKVEVGLYDKTTFIGEVVGKDPDTDLALVKIDAGRDLPSATLGDSSQIRVGQWAMAIGDPFGLDRTVTVGVISALGRENMNLSQYEDFIQTDASINPGNSGGPLFNIRGEVIGMNTAMIKFAKGIGFAIPSNMLRTIAGQLMIQGKVTRGWMGVGLQEWTPELASQFGAEDGEGILVSDVFDGNPASEAGILPGDVILNINGHPVNTPNAFGLVIAGLLPGEAANIELLRYGNKKTLRVELIEKESDAIQVSLPKRQESALGLNVQDLTADIAERFKIGEGKGVIITKVEHGSAAETEGLREGDLIKEINREKVYDSEDFRRMVEKNMKTEAVLLRIVRGGRAFFIVLDPEEK